MTLEELLPLAQQIDPRILYVIEERCVGEIRRKLDFWAHSPNRAYRGDTPQELLEDIRETVGERTA